MFVKTEVAKTLVDVGRLSVILALILVWLWMLEHTMTVDTVTIYGAPSRTHSKLQPLLLSSLLSSGFRH